VESGGAEERRRVSDVSEVSKMGDPECKSDRRYPEVSGEAATKEIGYRQEYDGRYVPCDGTTC